MKFLVLAYGDEQDWKALSKSEQDALLAQDEVMRKRGDLVAAVEQTVSTVKAWDGNPDVEKKPFTTSDRHLAGFGIIEADDLAHAIELVKDTPCARAKGAVELRAITEINWP